MLIRFIKKVRNYSDFIELTLSSIKSDEFRINES